MAFKDEQQGRIKTVVERIETTSLLSKNHIVIQIVYRSNSQIENQEQ